MQVCGWLCVCVCVCVREMTTPTLDAKCRAKSKVQELQSLSLLVCDAPARLRRRQLCLLRLLRMLRCFMTHFGHFLEDVTRHSGTNIVAVPVILFFIDLFWLLLLLCLCCLWSRVNSQLLCLFEFLLRFCLRQLIFIYTYFQLNIIKLTLRARANSAALDAHFAWFLFALLVPSSSYWRQIIIVVWHRFAISLFTLSSAYIPYTYVRESCPQ